ncbi:MAG: large repetitive protein, partial [Acidimicrobiaceae bacterium]|nr:large repetitive protein [Acidimicrobiaceae bacterium]
SNNGSTISAYVVTPFIGAVAQATQTFNGTALTETVSGLTAGTAYTFSVTAQNLAGTGPPSVRSSSVTPNVSPSLTFTAPPAGEVGAAYSRQLTVSNGTPPFVWSISGGTLPAGLTVNASTGLLNGTPTAAGTFSSTVQVVDASGQAATKSVSIVIGAAPAVAFTPVGGQVGIAYSQQPTLTGGAGPFTWTISAGSVPTGLSLNSSTGLLSGTPTGAGSFSMTVTVTDAFGQVASATVAIFIAARPAFAAAAPPPGQVGVAYSTTLDVTGGTTPYSWSIVAGSLPPGLVLNAGTGVVAGTPTTAGSSSFTASVIDANSQTATKAVTLVVTAGPLVIVKTANVSSAAPGGTVAYTITITNTGSNAWTGATLSDPLAAVVDDAVYNANATATAGTVSYAAATLGWTGNIAANGSVTIGYSVTVNNPDVGNKVLSNTVTSTTLGANCSPASAGADARCSAAVSVAGLMIVKSADVATTNPGNTVHFTIVVTNTGQSAYPAVTLTDTLAGVLDDAGYNADATPTSGSLSFASPSLTWTGSLAVGASVTITYSVTVANPDNGDRSLTGAVVSPSAGSPCPNVNPAPQCTATVAVLVPALAITTTASGSTTTPGATVGYTVTLSNTGQTAYTAIQVTTALAAALDDATYNANATASAGTVVFNGGASSLVWTGNLAIGAVVTITASVTVRTPDPGDLTLTTVTTSTAAGSTCLTGGSNPACVTNVQVRIPELTITKSANVATTTPGSVVRYTVSVTNTGQTAYVAATFGDTLTGLLDDASYNSDAATTVGTVSFSSSTLTWTGNLLIAASATITYSVTVNQPDSGNRTLSATVTSTTPGNTCPAAGSNPACTSSIPVLIPGFTVTPSVDATSTPGGIVHYSVTLVNTGQTAYTGLAVTLDVAGALDDAAYNYDATITTGDLVTNPDATVDWVLSLAPGARATGALSFTVNNPDTGDRSLRITAISDGPGSPCATGSANAVCRSTTTVLVPGLTITKSANASAVTPGSNVTYTIGVTNNGETTYPAAGFTDNLSTVLTDATYTGGATATTGTVSYVAPVVSWTGALAPGASATITYSIAVRDPDPGDKRMYNTVVSSAAGNNCPSGGTDPRCTATVFVLVPGLDIVTTANNPTTAPGAIVGYAVTVTNTGATAFSGASVSDSLSAVVDDATYNNDAAASRGTASFAGSTLGWTGDLAVGTVATITFSVTVHVLDGGNNLLTDRVTSSARGNNCFSGSVDTGCTTTVAVARLILAYGPANPTTTPGSVEPISVSYANTGQVPYVGISVSSLAPSLFDDVLGDGDQTASSGTLTITGTGIVWTGSIPVGGIVTLGATFTVMNPDTGDKILNITTESDAPGNNCLPGSSDSRCSVHMTVVVPALTIAKTASTTATIAGGSVGYTITVHNTGQTAYTAASLNDPLSGVLDDATYDGDAVATIGTVSVISPTLTWTGNLAIGATATITYSVTVLSSTSGDKTLVNSVSSSTVGSTCPPASGNTGCVSTVVVLTPQLTIQKTAGAASVTIGANASGASPVDLGSAAGFAVLPGTGVTNAGPTVINGDLGSCPIAAITGFPPGVVNGTTHAGDPSACAGHADVTFAYDDSVARAPTTTFLGPTELAGMTLAPGVYKSPTSFGINGTLTLDGQGDPNAVFILQAGSTLITGAN